MNLGPDPNTNPIAVANPKPIPFLKSITDVEEELKTLYEKGNCETTPFSKECNQFLLRKEFLERQELAENPEENDYLYPNLNDPNFIIKIAEKKEFQDTNYDGTLYNIKERADILADAEFELAPHQSFVRNFLSSQTPYNSLLLFHGLGSGKTCSAIGVCEEHREYMKAVGISKRIIIVASPNVQDNFRLQLFDERKLKLGPGGIWTMRGCIGNKLLKEVNPMGMKGIPKEKIIRQIKTLIQNSYLFLGYGEFANYIAKTENIEAYREKRGHLTIGNRKQKGPSREALFERNLRNEFNDRLIVIDEIHNIRETEEGENKVVATQLLHLVKMAEGLRFLLLSATPMYNSYKEIVWLLNLMNLNDRRAAVEVRDIFDGQGNFKKNSQGEEVGKELLIRKATGYVSFVRGDNPYTFPFRIYPSFFSLNNTFEKIPYPKYQMNGKQIAREEEEFQKFLKMVQVYAVQMGYYQNMGYKYIIEVLRNREIQITTKQGQVREMPTFENMDSFGYHILRVPLEASIIVYPIENLETVVAQIPSISEQTIPTELDSGSESPLESSVEEPKEEQERRVQVQITPKPSTEPSVRSYEYEAEPTKVGGKTSSKESADEEESISEESADEEESISEESEESEIYINASDLTGKRGLKRMMNYTDTNSPPIMGDFEYKRETLTKYGRIFSPEEIGKYSSKIKTICDEAMRAEGVLLIYSEYIPGGIIPVALALEELGFRRYGDKAKNLFKDPPREPIDVITNQPRSPGDKSFIPARYIMITGNSRLSPDNDADIKAATNTDNKDGHKIKVILISRAGSEGVDFKFIRQVHILEPWYNMSRIEQIIGRGVRNFSHKDLPFEKRNVQIFLYGTLLENGEEESADMYVYRAAYYKAMLIGQVTRLLKETSVDCLINHDQTHFSQENMQKTVEQQLSNGMTIPNFPVGDAPYSAACDYMESCDYKCYPEITDVNEALTKTNEDTYNEPFIMMNLDRILQKIRMLMKERFFYKKNELLRLINIPKPYPLVQIYAALTQLIEDSSEFIMDKYGRNGYLINIDDYYLFQPSELNYQNISIFDRSAPIDFKHKGVQLDLSLVGQKEHKGLMRTEMTKEKERRQEESATEGEFRNPPYIQELKEQFQTTIEYARSGEKIPRGEEDWYKHCGVTMKKMVHEGFHESVLLECLIEHIVDFIPYEEKVNLYHYYYQNADKLNKHYVENKFEYMLRQAMEKNVLSTPRFLALILFSNTGRHILIWKPLERKWANAEPEDELEVAAEVSKKYGIKTEKFAHVVGFVGWEHKNRYLVFKVKDMSSLRNKGARCDEAVKSKKIQILNEIVGREKYTKENTRGAVQAELCSLQEMLLRYYNKEKKEDKMWFLNYELAMIYKF